MVHVAFNPVECRNTHTYHKGVVIKFGLKKQTVSIEILIAHFQNQMFVGSLPWEQVVKRITT